MYPISIFFFPVDVRVIKSPEFNSGEDFYGDNDFTGSYSINVKAFTIFLQMEASMLILFF